MTDKQIIKLKPMEDLNEKIIKEKGNTKCIFYADDICRNGDKTRDCVNCARVEYRSLYSLNWDNQERLQKIIKHKEQECEELKKQLESTKGLVTVGNRQITQSLEKVEDLKNELHSKVEFIQEQRNVIDEYSKEIEIYKKCQGSRASKREDKLKQTLAEIKENITTSMEQNTLINLNKILQKISDLEV